MSVAVVSALDADTASPISKILSTLRECEAKVTAEGEEAQKIYTKFADYCQDRAANLQFEVKTATADSEGLQATVGKEVANQQVLTSQIDDFASSIATDEKDLSDATKIRAHETADFKASEADLVAVIDTLARAIAVIEREMASGGASMMQLKSAKSLTQAFKVMVQASAMNTADVQKLTTFAQMSSEDGDEDLEFGAPAATVYESHSGGIVDVLEGLRDEANEQLDKSRASERTALFNYEKLKQSLDDSIKFANEDLSDAKKNLAASQEAQASAQGDLDVTKKDLAEDKSTLAGLHAECMTRSEEFETEAKSRAEEMKGLAIGVDAMKKITLRGQGASFLQISEKNAAPRKAVHFLRNLARKHNDQVLAQLASRMASTVTMSSSVGEDVFAKIKEMIVSDIAKIQEEQAADATQKAYCDKEMAETQEKVDTNQKKIEKHTTKIEQKSSNSLKVKSEVSTLQEELSQMMKNKAEMDSLRQEEKSAYDKNKADTEQSLKEIKFALKTLRDFYGEYEKQHTGFSSSDGTQSGVIAMLETVESEFATSSFKLTAVEDQAAAEYTEEVKTFEVGKVVKEQAIKYKTKEYIGLDKYASEETTDREGVQSEFDANNEALAKLKEMCVGKPVTYEDRAARREEEIADLKETLDALEKENPEETPETAAAEEAVAEEAPVEAAAPAEEAPVEAAAPALVQSSVKRFRGGVRTRSA